MEITNAQIKMLKKSGFHSLSHENLKHTKILPYFSIVQSVEGNYEIAIGNGPTYQTVEGGFFVAPANVQQAIVHHVSKTTKKMSCRWIFIDVEINKAFKLDTLYRFPTVINDGIRSELNGLFDRLFETDNIWKNYSDLYSIVDLLLKTATPIPNETGKGIVRAIEYIVEHYKSKITVRELASVANMSESNFYAIFKKHRGISPIAFLNNYRLSIAADKLVETNASISEIGYLVGIGDSLYFSKLFKKTYGVSPKEYRVMYKKKNG